MWAVLYHRISALVNILFPIMLNNSTVVQTTPSSMIEDSTESHVTNTTMASFDPGVQERSMLAKIVGFICFFSLTATGVVGNSLVIYTIFTDFTLQIKTQLSNMPILSLAYIDLITTGICSMLGAASIVYDEYPFGKIVCGIWAYVNLLGLITTIGILAVISVDRFIAVGWSLHYPQMVTYNRIAAGCGYVWVMCLAVSVVWVSTEYGYDFWAGVCDVTWANFGPDFPREFYFAIVCAFIYVFIPSAIILACNLLIIQFSKEKGHAATAGSDGKQDAKSKANSKVLKAMIIVILSFFTLTFPSALIKILKVIGGKDGPVKYIPNIFTTFTTFLQLSASIVNPFIYGLFRKDFRDAYAKLWKQMKQALNLK